MGTFNDTVISRETTRTVPEYFFPPRVPGKINLMENIILGLWTSGEIPHSMTIYFILGLFLKSSVTSDYNEPNVSVTHVLRMIFYLSFLCVLWPHWLSEGGGGASVDQRNHCHLFHTGSFFF